MAKPRTSVTLAYQPNDTERFEVTVDVANDYPDCLAQARAEAVRAMRDTIGDTIAAYRLSEKAGE